jgi:hypothetical protein
MSRPSAWAVLAPLSALLAVTSVVAGFGAPLQPLLVGWFLLVCPGMAFVPLLRVGSPLLELALGAAVSIGLGVVVGQVMVFTDMWSPLGGLLALTVVTVGGAAVQLVVAGVFRPAVVERGR